MLRPIFRHRHHGAFGVLPAAAALFSLAVMLLWNAVLPALFPVPEIGFFQAFGLLLLCRILFGGLSPLRHGGPGLDREKMRRHWHNMSREEREAFLQKRRPFGPHGHHGRHAFGCPNGHGMADDDDRPPHGFNGQTSRRDRDVAPDTPETETRE